MSNLEQTQKDPVPYCNFPKNTHQLEFAIAKKNLIRSIIIEGLNYYKKKGCRFKYSTELNTISKGGAASDVE